MSKKHPRYSEIYDVRRCVKEGKSDDRMRREYYRGLVKVYY